ncbi:PGN_0703 family putative restriction endonuclease [Occallatibacter riparius]|uniref:Uncharacterized protein n=1 Tax=Occallatibacter riparius TaxID=1002689 RepID=A0A9J7BLA1_9BACT|nr:hypothetical protein [Occallatibacter riparius]UWZ83411.1 hypothetical protein MOP44_22945 [Occallatibacter riparius]
MALQPGGYSSALRRELAARNREWGRTWPHVESYGDDPVVVYCPVDGSHGNFYGPAYEAILARPAWAKRLNKVHTGGRALPRWADDPKRKWCELDSCMSSDALLMNMFCTPGVMDSPAVRRLLGVEDSLEPEFGWKAKVPLKSGLFDRTEVDMRLGNLLVEAKLTEADFQTRKAEIVEAYRDFDIVFDRELLPRVEVMTTRRRTAEEFSEAYTQEWEDTDGLTADEVGETAREFRAGLVTDAEQAAPREVRYRGYQLIRNVLAAYVTNARFCVICDERRPDLIEAWFAVMRAVRSAEMRTRLAALTWQELAAVVPDGLRVFLAAKYGIGAPGPPLGL